MLPNNNSSFKPPLASPLFAVNNLLKCLKFLVTRDYGGLSASAAEMSVENSIKTPA